VTLQIHLPGDADPSGTNVLVTSCFNFGTAGAEREHLVQPYLGTDYIVDGDMDDATLSDWTITTTGSGFSATRDSTALVGGGYSALLAGTGAGSGSVSMRQIPDSTAGNTYRLFGYYQTQQGQPSTATAYIQVHTTALSRDGYTTDASLTNGISLTNTHGRIRAFVFDHIAPASSSRVTLRLVNSAATACSARFDRVTYKPIHGWRFFHPRVAADGIPESEQGSLDVYPGSASTGSGQVKLLNDDTAPFERMFSASPWTCQSADIRIRYGGAFGDNGQEILWDDMFLGQSGILAGQAEMVTDEFAVYSFEEPRNIFEAVLPDDTYGDHFTGEERDLTRPRVRFWGLQQHVRPSRIDADGTTGLGIYELNDPTYAVGNAIQPGEFDIYAYTDEEAAERDDTTRRWKLDDGTDYTVDEPNGQFAIDRNPGVFLVTAGEGTDNRDANDRLDFVSNGTPFTADIPLDTYNSFELGVAVSDACEAELGSDWVAVTYSNTTHKFTFTYSGPGTFQLLAGSGDNKHRSILQMMGFSGSEDYTAATTYTSDEAVFTSPDLNNFIRCFNVRGYHDDASGTYTGTPNDPIERGPDVFRHMLHEMLGEPTSKVDIESFEAARTDCPQMLGAYLGVIASVSDTVGGSLTVQEFVDRLEVGGTSEAAGVADISLTGEGIWRWRNRATITDTPVAIFDRDYMTFEGSRNGSDAYGFTRVNYKQDPSTGYVLAALTRSDDTILRDRRPQLRVFDSYLVDQADAQDAVNALSFLTRAPIRHFRFHVVGALLGANPGDLVSLTRSRALQGTGETGGLDADEFRILYLKKNFLTRVVEVVVHTNITN